VPDNKLNGRLHELKYFESILLGRIWRWQYLAERLVLYSVLSLGCRPN